MISIHLICIFYLFDRWVVLDVKTEMAYFMTLPGRGLEPAELEVEWLAAASEGLKQASLRTGQSDGSVVRVKMILLYL